MNPNNNSKKEYREYAKDLRADLDIAAVSDSICQNIKKQDFFLLSENILSFYPFSNEIDLRELYKDGSKNWFLPKVEYSTRSITIHSYRYGDILVKNKWGILEPCCNSLSDIHIIDVAIIPALMADKKGNRLGYGAGFYDRFIPGLRKDCLKIVPIPEELFVDSLPADYWDIPVDKVITQNNIIKIRW